MIMVSNDPEWPIEPGVARARFDHRRRRVSEGEMITRQILQKR